MPVSRPMSRSGPATRSRTHRLLAGLAGLVLLAGCATSAGQPGAAEGGAPVDGGEVIYAVDTPLNSFDPNVAAAAQDARVMRQLYDSLVTLDADRQPAPWLATEWTVSDDGKTYTFTLRDDVTFHDGSAFDADAVCFNLDRIKDPKSASIYAIGLIGPYQSCTAQDATTAVVTLAAPYTPFLYHLSSPFLGIVSPKSAGSTELADFAVNPVGSGPFRFESYTPNDRIVLTRYADYRWPPAAAGHDGPPHLDRLTFQIIPDATVRIGSLRSGAIQGVGNVPETDTATIKNDPALSYVAQPQSGSPFQLHFNTDRPPFDDPEVRAAIRQGMDLEAAVQALYAGEYARAWGPLAPTTGGYDKSLEGSFDFDPDAARAALDRLGWKPGADGVREKDGRRLTLTYLESTPNREKRQDIANFVKANLADIGVAVDVRLDQAAALQTSLQNGEYDLVGLSLVGVDPNVLYSIYSPQFRPEPGRTGFNFTRTDDAELADQLLAAQREPDPAERDRLYAAVQHKIVDSAISIGVYVPTYTVAVRGLTGLRFDAEGYPVFYDVARSES